VKERNKIQKRKSDLNGKSRLKRVKIGSKKKNNRGEII